MARYIMGIDQSTQGTKALLVDERGRLVARADRAHRQLVNDAGWVSHDPAEIARNTVAACRDLLESSGVDAGTVAGIGISNQRETTVAWDAETGEPLVPAIVWQCARARGICERLEQERPETVQRVRARSGLALSPYYPAAKMAWLMEEVSAAVRAAAAGSLRLGTVDAWLVWNLTRGAVFACDYSNASRTQLFDIGEQRWSHELCALFGVPIASLPEVRDSDACFGFTDLDGLLPVPVPIHGVLGDSHAALFAQGCHTRGMAKATLGTGSSVMMHAGGTAPVSAHGLSVSLAWRLGGATEYVLEGNINYAGAVKTWLRDDMGMIVSPEEATELARAARPESRVYVVPAFSGLGAPHWCAEATGAVFGLTRADGRAEFVRAAVESIAFQVRDVVAAMALDAAAPLAEVRVDGGPTRDGFLMQTLADLCAAPVRIAANDEMSGLGAAWACGAALGLYDRDVCEVYGARDVVAPQMGEGERTERLAGWERAVAATKAFANVR